jgi:hypothetical protein
VLSAPLTVCLVVMGKHVTQMKFLSILLSDRQGLDPKDRFYHRLLVMDAIGAYEIVEQFLEEHNLEVAFDQVILPALAMSELDRHHGAHEDGRDKTIIEHVRDIIEQLEEADALRNSRKAAADNGAGETPARSPDAATPHNVRVVCVPARDEADELAALMLAILLRRDGHAARGLPVEFLAGERIDIIEQEDADLICISALPPMGVTHARYLYKRVRARFEDIHVLAGLWTMRGDALKALNRSESDERLRGVTSLKEGRETVRQLAPPIALRKAVESRREGELAGNRA